MNRLKELRLVLGWNMKKAAEEIGVPYTTYVSWEKEEREMNSETLLKLARFYGCTVDFLVGREPKTEEEPAEDGELIDVVNLLKDRPDLRILLDVGKKATPENVMKLADVLGNMKEG